ncbi:MAG: hypothetical protein GF329_11040 [Candidatus Lokiarchaeota archaeon]|nr:hypothetical protein [Candidatus Lokiarchaeota archaeon]
MPTCPECAGQMKWDGSQRRYVCQRCGLALKYKEIEEMRDKYRDDIEKAKDSDWKKKKEKKDYLNWWLSSEKK